MTTNHEVSIQVRQLSNGDEYARLVHLRAAWDGESSRAPYLVIYGDNYFDLAPAEVRTIDLTLLFPKGTAEPLTGKLTIDGTNLPPREEVIRVQAGPPVSSDSNVVERCVIPARAGIR